MDLKGQLDSLKQDREKLIISLNRTEGAIIILQKLINGKKETENESISA